LGAARPALTRLAIPAHREVPRMHRLHRVHRIEHNHARRDGDLIIHHLTVLVVAAIYPKCRFLSHAVSLVKVGAPGATKNGRGGDGERGRFLTANSSSFVSPSPTLPFSPS